VIDFVGQLGKLRADGIGAPAPRMLKNALFRCGHRFPFATAPKHKCYKTLWLHVYARKLSGIGRFRLPIAKSVDERPCRFGGHGPLYPGLPKSFAPLSPI